MSIYLQLHPVSPQQRFIRQAVDCLRNGGVIVYPTDSCYALGCHIGDKTALERIRAIRETDRNHHFTLVCRDLAEVGKYALLENWQYRLLRAHTPGPYTFLLKASRETPRRLKHERRGTIGRARICPAPMRGRSTSASTSGSIWCSTAATAASSPPRSSTFPGTTRKW
jgi:tRNA threonylcarbamoyl adenosine modification protein (Sua5/YciO/YrdC/YwlC family)